MKFLLYNMINGKFIARIQKYHYSRISIIDLSNSIVEKEIQLWK